MKIFLIPSSLIILLFSCHKKDQPAMVPIHSDTISAGWTRISVPATFLLDVFFVNNTGLTITAYPHGIFKSIDGGRNWSQLPITRQFENIGMGNDSNAIFVGRPNVITTTHNAGLTFDSVSVSDSFLSDVFFVNSSIAYVIGNSFWKTTDAGYHWTKLYDFNPLNEYKTLYFLNEQTGWVFGKTGLYKTADGGINWQLINITPAIDSTGSACVFFTNPNHGVISYSRSIGNTFDGGVNWAKVYSGSNAYHDIHFVNDSVGYMTDYSRILKTTNGGIIWKTEINLISGSDQFIELHFTDANHGWACGSAIYRFEK